MLKIYDYIYEKRGKEMNDTVEKLCEFKYKVTELLNDKKAHKHFRYHTLLLINEYFNFDRMLFTIYEEDLEVNCWKNSLDTISFGVDFYAINEYYNNFYNLDPMQKIKSEKHVLLLSEIEGDNFVESHYYKNFLEKYNVRYEVDANIFKKIKKLHSVYSSATILPFYIDQFDSWDGVTYRRVSDSLGQYSEVPKGIFEYLFSISGIDVQKLQNEIKS